VVSAVGGISFNSYSTKDPWRGAVEGREFRAEQCSLLEVEGALMKAEVQASIIFARIGGKLAIPTRW
jgi:hypothetical protein